MINGLRRRTSIFRLIICEGIWDTYQRTHLHTHIRSEECLKIYTEESSIFVLKLWWSRTPRPAGSLGGSRQWRSWQVVRRRLQPPQQWPLVIIRHGQPDGNCVQGGARVPRGGVCVKVKLHNLPKPQRGLGRVMGTWLSPQGLTIRALHTPQL